MIALDTNILARAIAEEADADAVTLRQQRQARALLSSGQPLFVPVTVVLELEWVLRGAYGMPVADALHLAHAGMCGSLATFDRRFAKGARKQGLSPPVQVP